MGQSGSAKQWKSWWDCRDMMRRLRKYHGYNQEGAKELLERHRAVWEPAGENDTPLPEATAAVPAAERSYQYNRLIAARDVFAAGARRASGDITTNSASNADAGGGSTSAGTVRPSKSRARRAKDA